MERWKGYSSSPHTRLQALIWKRKKKRIIGIMLSKYFLKCLMRCDTGSWVAFQHSLITQSGRPNILKLGRMCTCMSFWLSTFFSDVSQWLTWAWWVLTPFLIFWLRNYRIIASLYLTQQGVLKHWNREITGCDGMTCWSQLYYQLLLPLWW